MDCSQAMSSQVGGLVQQAVKQRALAGAQFGCSGCLQARKVDRAHAGWQPKARAPFAVAHAAGGGVHGQHQGFVSGGFGALHQRLGEAPVVLQIQLKPQGAAPGVGQHCLRNGLQRHAGLGAEHHARAQRRRRVGHGQLAVGVGQALKGNGCQQNRVRQRAAQQADPGVATRQRPQHARPQRQGLPGAAVGAQGAFVGGTAAEVGPGVVVQMLARVRLMVCQVDDVRGNLVPCGNVGHTSRKSI